MIIERLTEDLKAAMKSGDKLRLSTIIFMINMKRSLLTWLALLIHLLD